MVSCLANRRAGGDHEWGAQRSAEVTQAIRDRRMTEMKSRLAGAAQTDAGKLFIFKLQAILSGNRKPALAADPNLYYAHAAELQLLLEGLGG